MLGSLVTPFPIARRPQRLIGRRKEWETLLEHIYTGAGDRRLHIVLICGPGGIGKTRMLEELLGELKVGEEEGTGSVVGTELIDLIDPRLHLRMAFTRTLREGLRWAQAFSPDFNFNAYDVAISRYERHVLDNVEYRLIQQAARESLEAFWEDYQRLTAQRRLVWVIDTVEQLALSGSQWFLQNSLLTEDQVQFQTSQWILEAIQNQRLENTTLVLSGRDLEGKPFFEHIEKEAQDAGIPIVRIELGPFGETETWEFLEALAQEWEDLVRKSDEGSRQRAQSIAESLQKLTRDQTRIRQLHRLTEGRPVRLALLVDLILEGRRIPRALQEPLPEALSLEALAQRQWEIEGELVGLLFLYPAPELLSEQQMIQKAYLRQQILLHLIRVPMGLTAEQLHYLIDNQKAIPPMEWERQANLERIKEIEEIIKDLQNLILVKKRPPRLFVHNGERYSPRLGLQDEIYRIFAEHMAPHIHPGQAIDAVDENDRRRLKNIWENLTEEQKKHYEQNYRGEKQERQRLYAMLRDWAAWEREQLQAAHMRLVMHEEQVLELELDRVGPAMPRAARLRLSEEDQERRVRYRQALRELELEHMYYALLLNPDRELNEAYFDLADEFWRANDEDADIAAQELMWRVLNDRFAMRFVEWGTPRKAVRDRGEHTLDTLRRAALQEMASRWIKRLALRREYVAAQQFAEKLEAFIEEKLQDPVKQSWQHPFARGERTCWKAYARILTGHAEQIQEAIRELEGIVKDLKKLANTSIEEQALETGEKGFIGHPAEIRLRRVISVSLANIAYGYAQLGDFEQAIKNYSQALDHIRETGAHAHRATILNNLARVLAELGRPEALSMAIDALNLRWKIGADDPIGLSHSTLALIYNRLNQPERAWVEAAKAILFFQRVNDPRGQGLAAIQLGEALRRLAVMGRAGRTLPVAPEQLFQAAEDALNEAMGIFLDREPDEREREEGKVHEPLRRMEANLEKGRLYRDRLIGIRRAERPRDWQRWYSTALGLLHQVIQEADKHRWARLAAEAHVDLAWTHYWALHGIETPKEERNEQRRKLEKSIKEAFRYLQDFSMGSKATNQKTAPIYIKQQESLLHLLEARAALDQFGEWVQERAQEIWNKENRPYIDPKRIRQKIRKIIGMELRQEGHGLDKAVRAILESLRLSREIGFCAHTRTLLLDTIYEYFKRFNQQELEGLCFYLQQHPDHPERETLEGFLRDLIGVQIPKSATD